MPKALCARATPSIRYAIPTGYCKAGTPAPALELEPDTRWLGLDVKAHKVIDATHAEVHFVARYKIQGRAWRLEERSRFVCENGQWLYLDAIPAPA